MTEFHVAPQVTPVEGLPCHEWIVAFESQPDHLEAFAATLDAALQARNPYYKDLIQGAYFVRLWSRPCLRTGSRRRAAARQVGRPKQGPRLANDRTMADLILESIAAT